MTNVTLSFAAIMLAMPFSVLADWQWSEDLTVGPTDNILFSNTGSGYNYSEKTNTSLTVRGKATYTGLKDTDKYMQCFSGTAPKFSLGPQPGDKALVEYAKLVLNNELVEMTIGENGGEGCMKPSGSWANSSFNIKSLTLSSAAQTSESIFDALSIGHATTFVATTIKNDNVKPLRIKFTSSNEANQYRGHITARNTGKLFEIPKGDIILSGTSKAPAFIMSRYSWGYSLVKDATAASDTSGYLEFASTDGTACEVVLDCCGSSIESANPGRGHFIFNYNKIRWNNKGNVYLASCQDGVWAWLGKAMEKSVKGGLARLTVANALPYGPETGLLVVHGTMLDFNGNDQKVNGLVVRDAPTSSGSSVGQIKTGDSGKVTVTVGAGGVDGTLAGNLLPVSGEIDFVKVDSGTLVLSNATIRTLVVTGGAVRPAAGTSSTIESLTLSNAELVLKGEGGGEISCGTLTKGENAVVFRAEFTAGDTGGISFENAANWTCPPGVDFVNATEPAAAEYCYCIRSTKSITNYDFVSRDDVTYYGHIKVCARNTTYWPSVYLTGKRVMTFHDFRIGPYALFYQGNGDKTYLIQGKFTVYGDGVSGINMGAYYKRGILQFAEGVIRGDEKAVIASAGNYVPSYSNGMVFVTAENYRGTVRYDNRQTAADTYFTLGDTGDSSLKSVVLGTNMQFRAFAATDRVRIGDLTFKSETQFLPKSSAEGDFSCVTVTNALTLGSTPVRVKTSGVAAYPAKSDRLQRYPVLKWPTAKAAKTYTAADFDVDGIVPRSCHWTVWQEGDTSCFGLEVDEKKGMLVIYR